VLSQPTARNASAIRASTMRLDHTEFLTMRTRYGPLIPRHITLQADIPIALAAYEAERCRACRSTRASLFLATLRI
jgi:hypothetical protein